MAGKARRVASRQAQLSRRRKSQQERQPADPAESPTKAQTPVIVPPAVEARDTEAEPTTVDRFDATVEAPSVPAPTPAPRSHRPTPQPRAIASATAPAVATARGRRERPAAYNYIGPELRRITAMASVVLAVIIALGFVL